MLTVHDSDLSKFKKDATAAQAELEKAKDANNAAVKRHYAGCPLQIFLVRMAKIQLSSGCTSAPSGHEPISQIFPM